MSVLFLVTIVGVVIAGCLGKREAHLRRVRRQLEDERVLSAALSARLGEITSLSAVAREVISVLSFEEVLDLILDRTLELVGGGGGSILLVEDRHALRAVCCRGREIADGQRIVIGPGTVVGEVAADRQPVLVGRGREAAAVAVPMIHRGELVGVLSANAAEGRMFTEYDLRSLSLIAEYAAIGIVNARLYDAELVRVAELLAAGREQVSS